MKAEVRRQKIIELLTNEKAPVSATTLASKLSVSRQIIVGDIALLRASGTDISATPRGYVLNTFTTNGIVKQIACVHQAEQTEKELQIFVDNGCIVENVIVEHPIYGQLTGELNITSRYDVAQFIQKVADESAHALSELSNGIHLHTIICPNMDSYQRVIKELKKEKLLYK